jgi:hypothetical protein
MFIGANMNNLAKLAIAILAIPIFIAAGCEQKFRYPCQDPANWEKESCKKPLCEVNRDCPEYIFKSENKAVLNITPAAPAAPICNKGCNDVK